MTETGEMSAERQKIVSFMSALGWSAKREVGGKWQFTRPDTGGLFDSVSVSQGNMNWGWAMGVCQRNEPDLCDRLSGEFARWRDERLPALLNGGGND